MAEAHRIPTHPAFKDMTGSPPSGWLRVICFSRMNSQHQALWLVLCDPELGGCGKECEVRGSDLRNGHSKSCGCRVPALTKQLFTRHGHGGRPRSPEYRAWSDIKRRCFNSACKQYEHYGARGITICERWRDSFEAFLEDMGPRPSPDHEIDRIENSGHYSCGKCAECIANGWPANCRWATRRTQTRNTRQTRLVTYGDKTQCLADWAKEAGINYSTFCSRLKSGWPLKKALGFHCESSS